ncbi:hypothetical protein JIG36_00250 [Actinoplanes sp. LDG1-06]|uniref:Uncharacterized protein n=1 Tax=Paractinoplanes ovalisporus TaxID=2810368 RepID=A0ABS2A2R2_9ACTN|nr:hypothetical protein [Actinoplanes ovalisporus]MBM2613985.1 hypothetical protein [Actinoplanes ovalisporus]
MVTVTADPSLGGRWTSLQSALVPRAVSDPRCSPHPHAAVDPRHDSHRYAASHPRHDSHLHAASHPRHDSHLHAAIDARDSFMPAAASRPGRREWLWHRAAPGRAAVRLGDAFVDAGGLEECIPTIRGVPDHGDAWSRPWTVLSPDVAMVAGRDFTLRREFGSVGDALVAAYRLEATPGWRFLWAAHALLDLSADAWLRAPAGTETRIDGGAVDKWPCGLERLGPDDGTAVGAILVDCPIVHVDDGETLMFALDAPGQPVSTALWRNLRGWPEGNPYRSVGVEPMLGRVFDLAEAGPDDAAVVPAGGVYEWTLSVVAG